jgi:hypothetical protein
MSDWVQVDFVSHADARWRRRQDFYFAKDFKVAPVMLEELPALLMGYLLCFVERGQGFCPAVLLGRGEGNSFYVNGEGKWLSDYVPACLRGFPFALGGEGKKRALFIHDAHLTTDEVAPRLFSSEGVLDDQVQALGDYLAKYDHFLAQTEKAATCLATLGLIEPWPLTGKEVGLTTVSNFDGLYRVSEEKLGSLSVAEFDQLRQSGALPLVYGQLFSMKQMALMARRKSFALGSSRQEPVSSVLSSLFAEDETISFGFLDG